MIPAAPAPRAAGVTVFRKRRAVLLLFLAIGTAFTLQGIATAAFFATAAGLDRPLRDVVGGIGLFLAAVGAWLAAQAWRRLRGPDDAITIGPAGLHDRLLSDRPIPWAALRDARIARGTRGAAVLAFDLDDAGRHGILAWPRFAAPVNRAFGYGYYVFVMGTGASAERLAEAIAPYAPVDRSG